MSKVKRGPVTLNSGTDTWIKAEYDKRLFESWIEQKRRERKRRIARLRSRRKISIVTHSMQRP